MTTQVSKSIPARGSRFAHLETDELIKNALHDDQTRNLLFYIENELEKFMRDSKQQIEFPSTLSQYHKQLVLHISNRFGLFCADEHVLLLKKSFESAIPRSNLRDFWKNRSRTRMKMGNVQTSRGAGNSSNQPKLAGEDSKTKSSNTRAPSRNNIGGPDPSFPGSTSHWNNPYANNYQTYSNPYASHQQTNFASSNPNHKSRASSPGSNQSASYNNPYTAATKTQFTHEDMDEWVKSNQRRKKREQRKKHNRKAKVKESKVKESDSKKLEEFNSKVPFFPNKPFNKQVVDNFERQERTHRRTKPARRSRSSLPQHILHIYDFDKSISLPAFLPRKPETIRQSLGVFKSAKSPRNPFYHMCWNHNTERGCPRGNKCKWIHCFVGVMDKNYEMDHALIAFQNEYDAELIFVNPTTCIATFPDEVVASRALDSTGENSLFKLEPYSKKKTEDLSSVLPPSFFGEEPKQLESSV